MHKNTLIKLLLCTCVGLGTTLWPADALAQRGRHVRVRASRPIVVGSVFVGPSYRPYSRSYYDPFYWGPYGSYWSPYWNRYGQYPPYPYPHPYGMYGADSSARIQVTPREAEVYVDGYLVGLVDDFDGFSQRLHLPPGEHELEVYLPGYRTIRERLLFRPGVTLKIRHTMQPLAAGEAPEPRPQRSAQPRTAPPQTDPSQNRPRDRYPERPAPPAQRVEGGTLSIRVQPPNAVILVDGERWESSDSERLNIELREGTHVVQVQKDGYRAYLTEARIRRGEATTLNVSLSPIERP